MALPADTTYEIRVSTGSDSACSGGFSNASKGATGVDYTQQAGAQFTFAPTLSGVGTTTLTDSASGFSNAMLGNLIQITGQGVYCIVAYLTSGTVTLDRALGTFSTTAGYIGGAFATLTKAAGLIVAGNSAWAKAEASYLETLSTTTTAGTDALPITWTGYTTTRGDGGQVTIDAGNTRANCLVINKTFNLFNNFIMTGATTRTVDFTAAVTARFTNCQFLKGSGSGALGIASSSFSSHTELIIGCFFNGFSTNAITAFAGYCYDCEFIGCGPIAFGSFTATGGVFRCLIRGGVGPGILLQSTGANIIIESNTIYGKTSGSGIQITGTSFINCRITNNILAGNAAYGIDGIISAGIYINANAYWSNTSGSRNVIPAGANDVVISGTDPTNDPFVSKSTGNLALNATAGAGSLLRGAGFPSSYPAGLTASSPDFGAAQHPDPASGGGFVAPGIIFAGGRQTYY
jgi:hypothetical protein